MSKYLLAKIKDGKGKDLKCLNKKSLLNKNPAIVFKFLKFNNAYYLLIYVKVPYMKWHQFVAEYLVFSKKERNGIFILLFLIVGVFLLPKLFSRTPKQRITEQGEWISAINQLRITDSQSLNKSDEGKYEHISHYQYDKQDYNTKDDRQLFSFDPNTITADDWRRLGIREKTIGTIQNYLSKGGQFRKKEIGRAHV